MSFFDDASLVFLPSGEAGKDGKAYSMKPTDGSGDFTFSRGSNLTSTRVDSNGLIEKGRENLLLQSNQFDTAWTLLNSQVTSGQSGYDGSSDAWLLERSGSGANVFIRSTTIATSGICTISIYAKADNSNWLVIQDSGSSKQCYFDLSNGTLGFSSPSMIDKQITSVGNGWYRCSITTNRSSGLVQFYVATANTNLSGPSDAALYIQDAQLELGLAATEYIESGATTGKAGLLEDSPRFDYSGGASCPSLLLEPSRTQIVRQSEYIDGYSSKVQCTTTPNYGTSPEGLTNSTRLQFTANGYIHEGVAQVSATQYTISGYAKRNDSGTQSFGFFVNGSGAIDSAVTLTSDWQRFEYTYTATNSSFFGFAGNSGADVSVYGLQLEQGSYPTSYIPNHSGGSVTRNADSCLINPMDTTYSTNYTFYGEFERIVSEDEESILMQLYDGNASATNQYRIMNRTNAQLRTRIYFTGSNTSIISATDSFQLGQTIKWAVKYDREVIKVFIDGQEIGSTTQAVGGIDVISLERMKVKQILLFDSTLSDANLATLTS